MPRCLTLLTPDAARVHPLDHGGRIWLEGMRSFSFGSGPRAHLGIEDEDVEPLHARLLAREQKWTLVDLRTPNGTFVNEQKMTKPVVLRGGERLRMGRASFAFEERPFWPEGAPFVPQALPENEEEEQKFAILADWLQEHGHPLGGWMLASEKLSKERAAIGEERQVWLGPMALEVRRGQLAVKWRWGFWQAAAVLGPPTDGHDLLDQVSPLLRLPQGQLLERLYIDRRQFSGPLQPREDDEAMRQVLKVTAHPRLEEIVVRVKRTRWPLVLGGLRERFPRLKTVRFTAEDERIGFVPMPG